NIRKSIAEYLTLEGISTELAENGLSAQRMLLNGVYDAAVIDLKMPGLTGMELLTWLKEEGPSLPVIMISAFGEVRDAVEAMKLGALDYLVKPFNPEELLIKLRRAGEERRRAAAAIILDSRISAEPVFTGTGSPRLRDLETLIRKAAPTDSTILITGESGTGKEVYAKRIHALSARSAGPFIPINIGGMPGDLLESELFGYERGAFTGADRRKEGLAEVAAGGTLFLDEIGDMAMPLQVKILRLLQERRIQHLGGLKQVPVDVRILAATNRDLEVRVREGAFREDLFYRLNVIRVSLPPLRERREDIPGLVRHLTALLCGRLKKKVDGLTGEALAALMSYSFPGNIRELENMLERAIILTEGKTLGPADFSLPGTGEKQEEPRGKGAKTDMQQTMKEIEKEAIIKALYRREGNRTAAADDLGISRRTLFNKIKEYGIDEF
ncbi:MAG: sigma-54-dependent Fis family transcriptional regulator, partial [Spirochaetales bacterium]